ncbi:MAG TPA: phenylalanine--tRNA ligase subunit alpha [Thermoanaerobaculia bacterium]|nr:phenylalanine--tRNA ligase subunit alpha [Thermoanaerobaculia bacterium]
MAGGGTAVSSLEDLAERFAREVAEVAGRAGWEKLRLRWLGRKQGIVRSLLEGIKSIAPAGRRAYGEEVNRLKERVETALAELDARLAAAEREAARRREAVDVTLPGRRHPPGSLHPVTLVIGEMERIFAELGFSVAEGPEVEDDFHNFAALNFPPDHPARDTQDTFFLVPTGLVGGDGGLLTASIGSPPATPPGSPSRFPEAAGSLPGGAGGEGDAPAHSLTTDHGGVRLLRTHTSPVQIRTMLARRPPIRVICPGRVYRHDNDLRHSPMFHQVEALVVAEGITVGHLKGTIEAFCKRLFTPRTEIRLRPSFFPFTEPSAEVDVTCPFCAGGGCEVCSQTGWMEILGCGMVDPRVLATCGIDPDVYSGFAFGLGIDRVAMIRYGIGNIRLLFDNDLRLLRQVRG